MIHPGWVYCIYLFVTTTGCIAIRLGNLNLTGSGGVLGFIMGKLNGQVPLRGCCRFDGQ